MCLIGEDGGGEGKSNRRIKMAWGCDEWFLWKGVSWNGACVWGRERERSLDSTWLLSLGHGMFNCDVDALEQQEQGLPLVPLHPLSH